MFSTDGLFPTRFSSIGAFFVSLLLLAVAATPATAQNSEPGRQEKLMHYSLYYESFKNENFKNARSDLLWILENAPGLPKNDARNYRRAVELYKGLAKQADDEKTRKAYLDTAATYLTSAPKKMEKQGIDYEPYKWEQRKGRFVAEYESAASDIEGLNSPAAHYRKAFELAPKKVDPYYIQQVLQSYAKNNKLQKALDFANMVEKRRGDDEEVAEMISSVREDIFGKNPQAKISYLKKQVEAHPDSTQLLTELFDAYNDQGNVEEASKLAKRLMTMDPSAETIREIAQMRLEDGRPKAALEAYNRAQEQGAELKAEDYFNRGEAYQKMDQLAKARQEYRKAAEKKENFGRAYIAIGDLYARAVNNCSGKEMSRGDRAVYWAAVDKYRQAKEIDSSVASTANSKIKTYRRVFPSTEDIFYRDDWDKGGTFTIDYGCYSWIGETTSVRSAPSSG
ncbi:MAG: tetratricopeptide repeat protein [Salinibacter sp.]